MQPCPIPVPGQVAAERVVIGLQGAAEGKQNVALLDDVGRNGAGPGQRHAPHQEETRADSKIGYNTSFFQRGGVRTLPAPTNIEERPIDPWVGDIPFLCSSEPLPYKQPFDRYLADTQT